MTSARWIPQSWAARPRFALRTIGVTKSARLAACLEEHQGAEFFAVLKDFEEGREVLTKCAGFLEVHGHRGHQDRDIYYKRRIGDPQIDYIALRVFATCG
jgi:rifampicin phosphotransferase